ncbi:MAG: 50S ribosomal protein L21 [Chloroflexota bacterium]
METGGKQYKVSPGQVIDVERLDAEEGKEIELGKVLLVADGDKVTVGKPTVDGIKVMATSQGDGRNKKIVVFKYKSKTRYRRKLGHRQTYSRLTINSIAGAEAAKPEPVKKARRSKKEVTEVTEDGA